MTTLNNTVSKLLTLDEVETDEDFIHTHYKCDVQVALAGDSIWDCTLTEVCVTDIYINEGVAGGDYDGFRIVNVYYTVDGEEEFEDSWRMYTDSGFAEAISKLLGEEIYFTEQGMQDDGMASMQ
jgi:hypothetical protein